jgi:hypothetical protein
MDQTKVATALTGLGFCPKTVSTMLSLKSKTTQEMVDFNLKECDWCERTKWKEWDAKGTTTKVALSLSRSILLLSSFIFRRSCFFGFLRIYLFARCSTPCAHSKLRRISSTANLSSDCAFFPSRGQTAGARRSRHRCEDMPPSHGALQEAVPEAVRAADPEFSWDEAKNPPLAPLKSPFASLSSPHPQSLLRFSFI